jgi:putative Mn2+ efflux pump MntP
VTVKRKWLAGLLLTALAAVFVWTRLGTGDDPSLPAGEAQTETAVALAQAVSLSALNTTAVSMPTPDRQGSFWRVKIRC